LQESVLESPSGWPESESGSKEPLSPRFDLD
jgi:hypothetical protein